jgi:hypothetical protein
MSLGFETISRGYHSSAASARGLLPNHFSIKCSGSHVKRSFEAVHGRGRHVERLIVNIQLDPPAIRLIDDCLTGLGKAEDLFPVDDRS